MSQPESAQISPTGCRKCGPAVAEVEPAATSPQTAATTATPEVNLPEIKQQAYTHFGSGLHCAEVMVATILPAFGRTDHASLVKAASGLGGGIVGSTEELCGAFTGGVLVIGALLGRDAPGDELRDLGASVLEFKEEFAEKFGSLNCGTILDGFQEQGVQAGCPRLTAAAAVMVAEILAARTGRIKLETLDNTPRDKVALGSCPFSGGQGC